MPGLCTDGYFSGRLVVTGGGGAWQGGRGLFRISTFSLKLGKNINKSQNFNTESHLRGDEDLKDSNQSIPPDRHRSSSHTDTLRSTRSEHVSNSTPLSLDPSSYYPMTPPLLRASSHRHSISHTPSVTTDQTPPPCQQVKKIGAEPRKLSSTTDTRELGSNSSVKHVTGESDAFEPNILDYSAESSMSSTSPSITSAFTQVRQNRHNRHNILLFVFLSNNQQVIILWMGSSLMH